MSLAEKLAINVAGLVVTTGGPVGLSVLNVLSPPNLVPAASGRLRQSSSCMCPANTAEPMAPGAKRPPSSLVQATTSIGCAVATPASPMQWNPPLTPRSVQARRCSTTASRSRYCAPRPGPSE